MIKKTSAYADKNSFAEVFLLNEQNYLKNKSKISIEKRSYIAISSVKDIYSFDENYVTLLTEDGILLVSGNGLHIKLLSLETGEVQIEGKIDALEFDDKNIKEKRRLFKRNASNSNV